MSKFVRIDELRVTEVFAAEPVLHPDLMAGVRDDAPDAVACGWSFVDGVYAPPVPPDDSPVYLPISPRQIRLALNAAGMLAATEAAIAGGSESDKIEWEYATEYRRENSLISTMAAALGLTSGQVDAMWLNAMTL